MSTSAMVRLGFESAHRVPSALPGPEGHLHGHSWSVWVRMTADHTGPDGAVVNPRHVRKVLGGWISDVLHYKTLLGKADPLCDLLVDAGEPVLIFGGDILTAGLDWPTAEAVARMVHRAATALVASPKLRIDSVAVREKFGCSAEYQP